METMASISKIREIVEHDNIKRVTTFYTGILLPSVRRSGRLRYDDHRTPLTKLVAEKFFTLRFSTMAKNIK